MTASATSSKIGASAPAFAESLSRLAFGGAPIGNLYRIVTDDDAAKAVMRAWELGIRHFDTAPYYGYGLSESRIGDALRDVDRHSFTLSTKVGRIIESDASRYDHADGFVVDGRRARFDYSRDGILRSLEASLRRLRTDHIDVLLLHDIGELTHGENHPELWRQALDEALPTMAELREQGVCRAIGVGVNEEAICLQVMPQFPLDVIMLAGRYTLFEHQHSAAVMAQAQARGVAILAAGPYNSGLLGGRIRPGAFYNYEAADAATIARAQRYYDICTDAGIEVGAAAVQFPLAHPAVTSVVCGLRSVAEVESASRRLHATVPAKAWAALREAGLLAGDVPTP